MQLLVNNSVFYYTEQPKTRQKDMRISSYFKYDQGSKGIRQWTIKRLTSLMMIILLTEKFGHYLFGINQLNKKYPKF